MVLLLHRWSFPVPGNKQTAGAGCSSRRATWRCCGKRSKAIRRTPRALFHLAELYERAQSVSRKQIDALAARSLPSSRTWDMPISSWGLRTTGSNQYQEAVTNFTKATHLIPNQPMLYNNLAISYGKLGRTDGGNRSPQKGDSLRPALFHCPLQSRHGLREDRPAGRSHETIQGTQETGRRHCRDLKKRDRCEEEIELCDEWYPVLLFQSWCSCWRRLPFPQK